MTAAGASATGLQVRVRDPVMIVTPEPLMTEIVDEMYEGATKGLLVVEPGYRIEKGTTTLEQALDPHFAAKARG
jgi:hypothetical protein